MNDSALLDKFEREFNREEDLKALEHSDKREFFKLIQGIRNDALTIGEYQYNLTKAIGTHGKDTKPANFYQMAIDREHPKNDSGGLDDLIGTNFNGL